MLITFDKHFSFYVQNNYFYPLFRHLKHGILVFHRKHVLVSSDKAAHNNAVVRLFTNYIDTLKQELGWEVCSHCNFCLQRHSRLLLRSLSLHCQRPCHRLSLYRKWSRNVIIPSNVCFHIFLPLQDHHALFLHNVSGGLPDGRLTAWANSEIKVSLKTFLVHHSLHCILVSDLLSCSPDEAVWNACHYRPILRHCWDGATSQWRFMLRVNIKINTSITRAVRGSDYISTIVLSEQKGKFVTENWRERKMDQ